MPVGLITGASRGLGRAITMALADRGWDLVVDARDAHMLTRAVGHLARVFPVAGDVAEPSHREALVTAVRRLGPLDLLVNNAGILGPSPQPTLDRYPTGELERVLRINVVAPLALVQLLLPDLEAADGAVVNVTSDAAVQPYPGWGGYGASKAALEQATAILAAEQPDLHVYAFDPGDMRTRMHQDAFPGEDISDRPEPESVIPALLEIIERRPPSGRYRAGDLLAAAGGRP